MLLVDRDAGFGLLENGFGPYTERFEHVWLEFVQFELFKVVRADLSSCVVGQPEPLVAEVVFIAVPTADIPEVILGRRSMG